MVTSTRRQKQFLCQILISDANVVSVLEGLGALPLNWSYKAMPRSSRSVLVCDGLRLPRHEGRLYIYHPDSPAEARVTRQTRAGFVGRRPVGNPVAISHVPRLIGVSGSCTHHCTSDFCVYVVFILFLDLCLDLFLDLDLDL